MVETLVEFDAPASGRAERRTWTRIPAIASVMRARSQDDHGWRTGHSVGVLDPVAFRAELPRLKARLRQYAAAQRLFDLIVVIMTAPVVLTVLAAAALAIAVEDRGPILYVQKRVGRGGRVFSVLKLRTMRAGAAGRAYTAEGDDRITRVGRFLRPYRIDELPQVVNVLRGEMSICGPRPEALSLAQEYRRRLPGYALRYLVRPGITGWAQVTQGYAAGVDAVREKLERDLYFVRRASLWMDLRVLAMTIPTLARREGAR